MAARRAIVIGGSMGGLFAANRLLRTGWQVEVYERVAGELAGRGAGIVTHPELFQQLTASGVTVDASIGVAVKGRVTLAPSGEVVGETDFPQILTGWSRLLHGLRDAFPAEHYHGGKQLAGFEQDRDGVTARFADGESVRGDLLVAADGFRSGVRAVLLPEARPDYAGYIAWRGLVDEAAISPATHAALFEKFGFCLPSREQMLGYPIAGAANEVEPGRRRYNFVWYRPADPDTELRRLLTDADGRFYEDGIPPNRVSAEAVAEIRATADRILAPQFAELVRLAPQPFFQPIYDLVSPRLASGRVALVGDAGFVARPHCGMGVTKAGGDGLALAEALADPTLPVAAGLEAYDRERTPFGAAVVEHARRLGAYMQAQLRTEEERRMAERYRTPAAVMAETAVHPRL